MSWCNVLVVTIVVVVAAALVTIHAHINNHPTKATRMEEIRFIVIVADDGSGFRLFFSFSLRLLLETILVV